MFDEVIIVHSVRRVSDLAFHDELAGKLADDPWSATSRQRSSTISRPSRASRSTRPAASTR